MDSQRKVGAPLDAAFGCAASSQRILHWTLDDENLRLVAIWGVPSMSDVRFLISATESLSPEEPRSVNTFLDLSLLDGLGNQEFLGWMDYVEQNRDLFATFMRRSAVVIGAGDANISRASGASLNVNAIASIL